MRPDGEPDPGGPVELERGSRDRTGNGWSLDSAPRKVEGAPLSRASIGGGGMGG